MERREAVGRGVVVIELVLRRFWLVRVGSVLGPGSQGRVLVTFFFWTLAGTGWKTHAGRTSAAYLYEGRTSAAYLYERHTLSRSNPLVPIPVSLVACTECCGYC